jgi:hypothetical protein
MAQAGHLSKRESFNRRVGPGNVMRVRQGARERYNDFALFGVLSLRIQQRQERAVRESCSVFHWSPLPSPADPVPMGS